MTAALADEGVQRALVSASDIAALADVGGAILSRMGAACDRALLTGALRDARIDAAPTHRLDTPPPRQWLPVQIYSEGSDLSVEWLHFASAPLVEPFFEQSVARARALPANRLLRCTTPLAALERLAEEPMPDGFVFHMSRCGSTLVAQMLAALDRTVVVAEAPPFDFALQLYLSGQVPAAVVRGMIGALARDRTGDIEHRFVKLDAWHTLALDPLALLFPAARRMFAFRDASEVIVSQMRRPGLHVVPGAIALDAFGVIGADRIAEDDYPAWVLDRICGAAADVASLDPTLLLLDYTDLPGAVAQTILPHFRVTPSRRSLTAMAEASDRDTKTAGRKFIPDAANKRAEADRVMAGRFATALAATIERLRNIVRATPGDCPLPPRPERANVRVSFNF